MEIGKIPNDILKDIIIGKIKKKRNEVLIMPKVGEDCSALDLGGNVCVLSTDPVTGAVNNIGRLAVHISCNDVASCGAEPVGLLATILAPPQADIKDIEQVMMQMSETADSLNVDIIGGHTEVTSAVNRFVIISTAVGKVIKDKLVSTSGACEDDSIIMTKYAGLEGTAIIAADKEHELERHLNKEIINKAKNLIKNISVVREGIIAGKFGVNSMHDVTEGGILGAIWEVMNASGKGAIVYKDRIPITEETAVITKHYDIDPLRLISSGSMIITCKEGDKLVKLLQSSGINASIIGRVTKEGPIYLVDGVNKSEVTQPKADELYKVFG